MPAVGEATSLPPWVIRVLVGRNPKRTFVRVIVWVVALLFISKYLLLPVRIKGDSMLPTYKENGVNLVNRLAYLFHEPRRGDVVAIRLAGEHVMYLKRIIALPGETIEFHQGRAMVNGRVLDEPYLKLPCNWEHAQEQVAPDEYYVVGDNRSMDYELHTQGRATRDRVVGKVLR
jgi:signal peptidase I